MSSTDDTATAATDETMPIQAGIEDAATDATTGEQADTDAASADEVLANAPSLDVPALLDEGAYKKNHVEFGQQLHAQTLALAAFIRQLQELLEAQTEEHDRALRALREEHRDQVADLTGQHSSTLSSLEFEHSEEVARLTRQLETADAQHDTDQSTIAELRGQITTLEGLLNTFSTATAVAQVVGEQIVQHTGWKRTDYQTSTVPTDDGTDVLVHLAYGDWTFVVDAANNRVTIELAGKLYPRPAQINWDGFTETGFDTFVAYLKKSTLTHAQRRRLPAIAQTVFVPKGSRKARKNKADGANGHVATLRPRNDRLIAASS